LEHIIIVLFPLIAYFPWKRQQMKEFPPPEIVFVVTLSPSMKHPANRDVKVDMFVEDR
jgi:hypothetical protein